MFKEHDFDQNDTINLEEFKLMMQSTGLWTPELVIE